MANPDTRFLQPSSSSLATSVAAAFNVVNFCGVTNPEHEIGVELAKKMSGLIGECAKIIHDKVAEKGEAT